MLGTRNRLAWPTVSSDLWRDMQTLNGSGEASSQWTPAATVVESDAEFTLRLELSGVTLDSISVDLDAEHLTISGERPAPADEEACKIILSEVMWGPFHRRFRLGSEADRDAIVATHRDGLLEITVPKRQEARPRRIPVSAVA